MSYSKPNAPTTASTSVPTKAASSTRTKIDVNDLLKLPEHNLCKALNELTPSQVDQLATSIEKTGQLHPVTTGKGFLIDGRHRLKAMKKLKNEGKHDGMVDVDDLGNASEEQIVERISGDTFARRQMSTKEKAQWASAYRDHEKKAGRTPMTNEVLSKRLGISVRTIENYCSEKKNNSTKAPETRAVDDLRADVSQTLENLAEGLQAKGDDEVRKLHKSLRHWIPKPTEKDAKSQSVSAGTEKPPMQPVTDDRIAKPEDPRREDLATVPKEQNPLVSMPKRRKGRLLGSKNKPKLPSLFQ